MPTNWWVIKLIGKHSELSLRTHHNAEPLYPKTINCIFFVILVDELKEINNDKARLFNVDDIGFEGKDGVSKTKVIAKKGV